MPGIFRLRDRAIQPDDFPIVMGILNVTPDSFSDGGLHSSLNSAVSRAEQMLDQGAAIIDIGPESTRPGAHPVSAVEQIRRAVPVIGEIRRRRPKAILSIDTRLAAVARQAIAAGADLINDTAALRDDPELPALAAESGVGVILMHRRGTPADMQKHGGPTYDDVCADITAFFRERLAFAASAGIDSERIALDPGIGFGKRLEHNIEILRRFDFFNRLHRPVVLGASRKRFIGELAGIDNPRDRLAGSVACAVIAAQRGAAIIRAHDVAETHQALVVWRAANTTHDR